MSEYSHDVGGEVRLNRFRVGRVPAFALTAIFLVFVCSCSRPVSQPMPEAMPSGLASGPDFLLPLRAQHGQRCLVDQTGQPFLLHGDSPWSILVQLTRDEVDRYLKDRRRRGFNTLLVNLIEHEFAANAPKNVYGEAPFNIPGDYTRPNEKYFAHVDWVLTRAAEHGFVVLLTPSFLGYGGRSQGWYHEMRESGAERLKAYGRYLGLRYRNMTNIIWIHGGDYNPPERALMQAIVDGLRETNPKALHSYHAARGTAARAFLGDKTRWLGLNTIYTDENSVVSAASAEYRQSYLPFILIEGHYEGEGPNEAVIRAQAYQAMLSGACGQLLGNKYVWPFIAGWQEALDSPGARSMAQMRSLLDQFVWWQLKPIYDGFIVDGVGAGAMRVAAAVSEDQRRAVIYIPSTRDITINTGRLKGPRIELRWIDPANGNSLAAAGPTHDKSQVLMSRSPDKNSSGYSDWVLVLESRD